MSEQSKHTPTPLTDAAEMWGWSGDAMAVEPEFARRLERDRAALLPVVIEFLAVHECGSFVQPDPELLQQARAAIAQCKEA